MLADILVHVDATEAGAKRLSYAFDLAERHRAHLTGMHVRANPDIPPLYKPSVIEHVTRNIEVELNRNAVNSRGLFQTMAAQRDVRCMWLSRDGSMASQICAVANTTDLTIVGQYEAERNAIHNPLSLAESVVLGSGAPVLALPEDASGADVRRVLLAWDGTCGVTRATQGGLSLLREAQARVEVVVVGSEAASETVEFLCRHLCRHGITVDYRGGPPLESARVLLDLLRRDRFDLLIMGAYDRPAWLEYLIGGPTSSVLKAIRIPVLLSH